MLQTSWSILRALGVGNFNREANLMRQRFESRMRGLQNLMRTEVGQSGSTVLRCNPTEHVEGRTYERLTKLLQGSVERQDKLPSTGVFQRPPFCLGSCLKSNGSASATSNFLYCDNVPAELWTCPAVKNRGLSVLVKRTDYYYSLQEDLRARNYEYIEYQEPWALDLKVFGRKEKDCLKPKTRFYFYQPYMVGNTQCAYCFCVQDKKDAQDSDRSFSLEPVRSEVSQNK